MSPTQFQVVVDSDSDMIVHTVIHLGMVALDAVSMVTLFTAGVSSVAASSGSFGAGLVLGEQLLEGSAMAGISLASDAATLIDDIAHYCGEGKIIVTMGPKSTAIPDLLGWIVI